MPIQLRSAAVLFFCAGLLPWASTARAVILYSSPTRNGTPDTGSIAYPAWQLEGTFGAFLGTPIASQYFVTAAHFGLADTTINFQGQNYHVDTSYANGGRQLDSNSDLAVVKIQETFPTFAHLYTTSDEVGKTMVTIGRGIPRGSEVRVGGQLQGWAWDWSMDDGAQSWGQNTVAQLWNMGAGYGQGLGFTFSGAGSCTIAYRDSGGGVFIQVGDEWRLAGINLSVDGHYSFTGPPDTVPFDAAMFDKRGLYEGNTTWDLISGASPVPASAYATRISSNLAFINASIPEPGIFALLAPALGLILRRRR